MNEEYKTKTIHAYDTYPEAFDEYFGSYFQHHLTSHADSFMKFLCGSGRRILDLGSGPGNHAACFHKQGMDVLCVDLSQEMVRLCREKGLKAEIADIEHLEFPDRSFDGIWANASLLHIPRENIPPIVLKIAHLLTQDGILFLAFLEGDQEGFRENPRFPGTERWFTFFTDKEVRDLFEPRFEIIEFWKKMLLAEPNSMYSSTISCV